MKPFLIYFVAIVCLTVLSHALLVYQERGYKMRHNVAGTVGVVVSLPKLVVVISGGCLDSVYSSQPVECQLIDADDLRGYGMEGDEIDRRIKETTAGMSPVTIG